jgi:hypothetical protein
MVQTIQCYVDGKGGLHRSAADAHRADVAQWFQATSAVNEAGAAALAKTLVDDRERLFELISMLEAVARDTSVERTEMPATAAIMLAERKRGRAVA